MSFLRPIEKQIKNLDIVVADGKNIALHVLDHADQIPCPLAVLVDADFWSIEGVPVEYQGRDILVITDGYSIENDLIRDANLCDLLHQEEIGKFSRLSKLLSIWFSCCHYSKGHTYDKLWKRKIGKIVSFNNESFTHDAIQILHLFSVDPREHRHIHENFLRMFRGKSLKSLFQLFFAQPGRMPHLEVGSLMAGAWVGQGPLASRLKNEIQGILIRATP